MVEPKTPTERILVLEQVVKAIPVMTQQIIDLGEQFRSFTKIYEDREKSKMIYDDRMERTQKEAAAKLEATQREVAETAKAAVENYKINLRWWVGIALTVLGLLLGILQYEYNTKKAVVKSDTEVQDSSFSIK